MINGRYQRQRELGAGGMGVVYLVIDRLSGDQVALKQITLPTEQLHVLSDSVDLLEANLKFALAHEFQVMASLRHPHIINVLDYGFDEAGNPFFTMPYLAAAQTFLQAGTSHNRAGKLALIEQLLQALTYLHRRDIIHHDLKPSNILVSAGVVKVLDFGLAISNKKEEHSSGGSPYYLAPEIWTEKTYSTVSDMFAVGILAYQLFALNHSHPFAPLDHLFLDRVLDASPDWSLLRCDEAVISFIRQLLAKEPQQRLRARDSLHQLSRLLGQRSHETSTIRESYLQAATFVGREAEMSHVNALLAQTKTGQGQGVLIGGESGVGKSRFVNEVRIQALVDGFLVLQGQTVQDGGLPYQLWQAPIRRLCLMTTLSPLAASVLYPLIPDLPDLIGREIEAAPQLDSSQAQQRLFSVIMALFREQKQPILLILEDLQWARGSLKVLHWLLRNIATTSLLVLGTYRADERPLLPEQLPNMIHMVLKRLTDDNVHTLCRQMLGEASITKALITFLQQQSEGNTFFLVEVVRALAEQAGRLDTIRQMQLPETVIPASLATILERRLTLLPARAKRLLNLAAVAGRQLDHNLMRQLATSIGEVLDGQWLPAVTEAGLISVAGEQWQFAHDKLREGLLAQFDKPTMQTLHRQVALALETVYPNDLRYAADLMWHWGETGDYKRELFYAQQAGRYAQAQNSAPEALVYWERAEKLLSPTDLPRLYEVYMAQEAIYARQGNREAQRTKLNQLQGMAKNFDVSTQGEIALRLAEYARVTSDYDQVITHAQEAVLLGKKGSALRLVAAGHHLWGEGLRYKGEYAAAQTHFQTGLHLSQALQVSAQEANCLMGLAVVAFLQGGYEAAQQYYRQALAIWQAVGDQDGVGKTLNNLGVVMTEQGAYRTAQQQLEQALTIWQAVGDRYMEGKTLNNLGGIARSLGTYTIAKRYLEQALVIRQETGDRHGEGKTLNHLAGIAIEQGIYDIAKQQFEQALKIEKEIGHRLGESSILHNLGAIATEQGAYDIAQQWLQQALTIQQESGERRGEGLACHDLGHLFLLQGDMGMAETFYQQAFVIHEALHQYHYLVADRAGLARVKLAIGDRRGAQQYVTQILAYLKENGRLDGTHNRMITFHSIWKVLMALAQTAEADKVLSQAAEVIQDYLDKNQDPTLQVMYLNQPYHAALWQAWQAVS